MANSSWGHSKNMFVLTIGIDEYQHVSNLSWAAADADAMESFFQDVGVPLNRFMKLRDASATRENILKAFQDLRNRDSLRIRKDDPIVIYFAGHGTLVPSSNESRVTKIQAICPHDVEVKDSNRTIFPIPDYLLASLINQLSKEKGNNITVIFDCCYSASGTRDHEDAREGVRRVIFHGELPSDLDKVLMEGGVRLQLIPPGLLDQHSRSHVFLAACGANELAYETDGHGLFTEALLKNLRKPGVDEISFIEFMKEMPCVKNQTPQCEGHFKDRVLFSSQIPEMGLHFYQVVKGSDERYEIEAGRIHGVTKDSLFDVFEKALPKSAFNKPIGTLRVEKVYHFSSDAVLEPNGEIVKPAFALQVQRSPGTALQVHFSSALLEQVRLDDVLNDVLNDEIVRVGKESADFIVDLNGTKAVFITTLDIVMKHGYQGKLSYEVEAKGEPISRVLLAACRWKHHLLSSPGRVYWRDEVDIEFFRLQHMEEEEEDDDFFALERNNASKLNDGNVVVIEVMPDDLYGLQINRTKGQKELHLSLVLFQIDNLTIEILHDQSIGTQSDGSADPSLPPNSSLQIGCGIGGGQPFAYRLQGIDIDVAILKLYLTTKPMSFKWLEQPSPFKSPSRYQITGDELKRRMKSPDQWDTVLFTVVQLSPNLSH